MHDTKDDCATCAHKPITADQIVNDILFWDDPQNIREILHELMLAYFMFHESPEEKAKGRIYCTYIVLTGALKQMEQLKN